MNENLRQAIRAARAAKFRVTEPPTPKPKPRVIIKYAPAPPPPEPTPTDRLLAILRAGPPSTAIDTVKSIQRLVCSHYGFTLTELVSIRRLKPLCLARATAMYLAKIETGMSYPQIGRRFGDKDHTTIMAAVQKIEKRIATDPNYAAEIETLRAKLREGGMANA